MFVIISTANMEEKSGFKKDFYLIQENENMRINKNMTPNGHIFFVEGASQRLAALDFRISSGVMMIELTEAEDRQKGKYVKYELVEHAAVYTREKHLKVMRIQPLPGPFLIKERGVRGCRGYETIALRLLYLSLVDYVFLFVCIRC
ncbi:MAG: hypothetical protein H7258_00330 [Ferruginibacter sp.]|nr:hypothetical protein [Ferruginibacter sp.]